jgi:hypothetical protein
MLLNSIVVRNSPTPTEVAIQKSRDGHVSWGGGRTIEGGQEGAA